MYLYLSHDVNSAAFRIHFPSTLGQVQHEIAQMGGASPVQIVGTSSYADRLGNYIRFINLSKEANIEKLNQLAEQVDSMDERSERIFSGALNAESINGLDDVVRVASSLGQYEFIRDVTSDKELGGWLVEHGLAGVDFPEQVRPYLDYAGIGAEYYAAHGGAYTAHGYVKRREMGQTQAAENKSRLTLELVVRYNRCCLDLLHQKRLHVVQRTPHGGHHIGWRQYFCPVPPRHVRCRDADIRCRDGGGGTHHVLRGCLHRRGHRLL